MLVIYLTVLVIFVYLLRHVLHKYYPPWSYDPAQHLNHSPGHGENAPRYPHLDPLFGLDLALQTWRDFQRGELSEGMRRRHLRHGRTFAANSWGAECIYTIEPDNIRAVTTHEFDKFGKSAWVAEAAKHVGSGVLLNEGPAWKHSRTMLKPIFNRSALDEPALLEPHVRRLVDTMRALSSRSGREGEGEKGAAYAFDFHELASMFTLDVVTEFLFGKSTLCLQSPRQQSGQDGVHFLSLVKDFEGPSGKFIAVGPLAWLGLAPSYRRLIGLVDGMKAFFRRKLNDIIQETKPCGSGVAEAAPRSQSQSPSVFRSMKTAGASDDQIQGEVQNIFFASYDTTSAFLANVMHVLVQNPGIQLRLRREISILDGRLPTNKDLSSFEYLRLFLMEALRLYSPVSSHSRTARVDTILPRGGGEDGLSPLVVRAGATVIWSTYSLNRDPRLYGPDWAAFRPERWESGSHRLVRPSSRRGKANDTTTFLNGEVGAHATRDQPAYKGGDEFAGGGGGGGDTTGANDSEVGQKWRDFFMPFGSGPRSCLGQQMVQSEVAYVIVRLLQEFQEIRVGVEDAPNEHGTKPRQPFKEAKAVSFYNADGVMVSVESIEL